MYIYVRINEFTEKIGLFKIGCVTLQYSSEFEGNILKKITPNDEMLSIEFSIKRFLLVKQKNWSLRNK